MNPAQPQVQGDDLFQFEEPLPTEPAPALPAATTAESPRPAALDMAPGTDALRPMGLVDDTASAVERLVKAPTRPPAIARSTLPPVVVLLLSVVALANVLLVGLTWRSLGHESVEPVGSVEGQAEAPESRTLAAAPAPLEAPAERRGTALRQALPPLPTTPDDARAILDQAEQTLQAGEPVAARRQLYALLTVLDRVQISERQDIEARAGYWIAETYRQEARAAARGPAEATLVEGL